MVTTTLFIRTKDNNENLKPVFDQLKQKGYFLKRRLAIFLLLVILPLLLILKILDLFGLNYFYLKLNIVLVLVLIFLKIKPEDNNLFEQLKLNNYFSWTFQPKDEMKIAFVLIFSILIISGLLIKLIESII